MAASESPSFFPLICTAIFCPSGRFAFRPSAQAGSSPRAVLRRELVWIWIPAVLLALVAWALRSRQGAQRRWCFPRAPLRIGGGRFCHAGGEPLTSRHEAG